MNKLNTGEQILFTGLSVDELLLRIEQIIDSKMGQLPNIQENQSEYITRKEVAKLLKITLPTLHDWTKQGFLQSYRIGNRILYKLKEVEQSLTHVLNNKHKKFIL